MHHAARQGSVELLSYLDQKLDVNQRNAFGYTPLHVAVESRNREAVKWLVDHGADLEATTIEKETALEIAVSHKYDDCKRILELGGALMVDKVSF